MSRPVAANERIESLDVLRGFALLGILLVNMPAFAMPVAAYMNPTAYGDLSGANLWAWALPHVFADLKFISIFSMLFGAGILLMAKRAESRGASAARLHYRRMGWMIFFGILHGHLLWFGDILYTYGMTGLLMYLFRNCRPRLLVLSALVLAAVPSLLLIGIGLTTPYWPSVVLEEFSNDAWQPNPQTLQEELAAYRGSFLDQTTHRFIESLSAQMVDAPLFLFGRVGGLMLLGMALFKLGALSAEWSRRQYLALIAAAAFVGIPVIVYGIYENFERNWDIGALFFGIQYNYWGSYLVALGWVGLIMIWCQSGRLRRLKTRVAAVGRTAFSNYILQTLVCTTIFYGHGFGYFGSVDRVRQMLLVFVIYAVQLTISHLWLKHFTFGPLEWIWRRLTYGKSHPVEAS
jgi:uncharacterized protein